MAQLEEHIQSLSTEETDTELYSGQVKRCTERLNEYKFEN